MTRRKYEKDQNGNSILGEQFGITVTRPWSKEMYDHNDDIASTMKNNIFEALNEVKDSEDEDSLRELSKHICYYSFGAGYDTDDIYLETCKSLDQMENFQLHENYEDMVKDGFVKKEETGFVGYDKL